MSGPQTKPEKFDTPWGDLTVDELCDAHNTGKIRVVEPADYWTLIPATNTTVVMQAKRTGVSGTVMMVKSIKLGAGVHLALDAFMKKARERLQGRVDMNRNNDRAKPDQDSRARASAYANALVDIELIMRSLRTELGLPCDCCERGDEHNGFGSDGPIIFHCPKDCPCHD